MIKSKHCWFSLVYVKYIKLRVSNVWK